ncbi:preprotein translocase subunit YajC [Pirellulimonas nuda]|uniref:Sec translocon accessory complex subunit YajC n=1 Tax=Pirellulimonas nuda TaxID=2528009 RepID=A0A518D9F5_9BACT|nr:preprotein translocase subunit YajC [Pirellulimonas nuda]
MGAILPLAEPAPDAGPAGILQFAMPAVTIALLAYFLLFQPQRMKDQRLRQLVDNLKENDHVITSGGLHGVVTAVQREQGRVTLRIDETTGAKVRVDLWAISRVADKDSENTPSDSKTKK